MPTQDVRFPGLETHDLGVLIPGKKKRHLLQIRETISLAINLPIVRIALERQPLARHVLSSRKMGRGLPFPAAKYSRLHALLSFPCKYESSRR